MTATLSILTFPQRWKNNKLTIRTLIIPRNLDPTLPNQIAAGTPAWNGASIALKACFIADQEKISFHRGSRRIFFAARHCDAC